MHNISNNVIENLYAPAMPTANFYAILATGHYIQILNTYVKNLSAYTGIYAKSSDLLIKGNTLLNAGAKSSICVKNNPLRRPDDGGTDYDSIVVEDNIISSSIDAVEGGVLNFSGNYVNTKEALINRLFYMGGMTLNMNDNTIISQ